MKITGPMAITGRGNILSGYYSVNLPFSSKPKLFELSSPTFDINRFSVPFGALLIDHSDGEIVAAGRRIKKGSPPIASDRSGAFYYYDTSSLIGTCHGFGRNDLTYYSGYNFYNAFYPAGYFQPPFGETPSLYKLNKDGFDNLNQGACFQMNVTEYNEQFGIVSETASDVSASSSTLTPDTLAQIMSLKEVCPDGTIAVSTYYEEVNLKRIPGTASSLTAPTFYNHNAIPTSLDNYDLWVDGRYKYTVDTLNKQNLITFGSDQRPIPNYPSGGENHSKLNNILCFAQLFETETAIGRLTNGLQRIETPDVLPSNIGSQVSAAGQEPWHYWHFIFKENSETIPFASDFKAVRPGQVRRSISQGTAMFTPILSSEDMYWQNRQCPDTVDFLPWNFGASIYACPSEHFDIPYYAAIKKFGFYGTRFLNSCSRLDLNYKWNGVENALEVEAGGPLTLDFPDIEPPDIDTDGSWGFSSYDNLLRVAHAEERYANMYALNKGFFLWANTGCITTDSRWNLLSQYDGFGNLFSGLVLKFQDVYQNGLSSFISGEPRIIIQQGEASSRFSVLDSGKYADLLFTNDAYIEFSKHLKEVISGDGIDYWKSLENDYSYYISDCQGGINKPFYNNINSGREKRMRTRYFEGIIRGNPIDLFPMNHIMFSTDLARSYLESTGWARTDSSFGRGSRLPPIEKRYFQGAYGNSTVVSGIADIINRLSNVQNASFYPGFFNTYGFGKMLPSPLYVPVISGYIQDSSRRRYSPSGWLAAGYNEVGSLDSNFSCFTPIFIQQPLKKVFCKVGQHPTLRAQAVDYHTIPEDKINFRYPEIIYWTHKLKIINGNFTNNYPLQYKWFRVLKSSYNDFAITSNFDLVNFSSTSGEWCALEGDSHTCTIIHPNECVPNYVGSSTESYTFLKGIKASIDDNYYYFCLVQGRFGVRISEPTELVIEDWVRFDISQKNGMNVPGQIQVDFLVNDSNGQDNTVSFSSDTSPAYAGYQRDKTAIPEGVIEQKIPPPNAGFGDVSASRFIGPFGYVGATRSYAPDTLRDTRGLREMWGRMVDYGSLIPLSKRINQREGDLLYGYQHLPTCTNYSMAPGQYGIKVRASVNGNLISHWTLEQQAFAALESNQGMKWDKVGHVGSLYPPAANVYEIFSPRMGIGHWQWGTNLGSIKRFGYLSQPENNDLVLLGDGFNTSSIVTPEWMKKIKDKFIQPTTLAGSNCGYTKYGLGRNMLYYIEAFDRFYLICDPVKKKNIQNISFMCPGLRNTSSAIQYCWLGQPNNTYVERRPMFGPYAFQWRVKRHNRDRNGNGMSQGFYSPAFGTRYELMYDIPAIYGLYVKREASSEYMSKVNQVLALRKKLFGVISDYGTFRSLWFGEAGSEGSSRRYGNFTFSCDPSIWAYNSDMCDYVSMAKDLANNPDFRAYSCPEEVLQKGGCFDPCLSIRYGQGFFPGGKSQNMFGYTSDNSSNLEPKNLRLVPMVNFKQDAQIIIDEQSITDKNAYFRSPINTPHARVWRGLMKLGGTSLIKREIIAGVSPCKDGGSDHCNYLTPTIHLDTSSVMLGQSSAFNASMGFASNIYQIYDIRGGD